jgi:pimeloyl-ACP methyl ester carboxylesterase
VKPPPRHALNRLEAQTLEGGRPIVARHDGGRLIGWSFGSGGPTALLVHGGGGWGAQLIPFVAPLVDAGFRVVLFDAPAHGASDGDEVSLVRFREGVASMARRVGPVDAIVAHSLGAAATTLALAAGLRANRAVFIGPPASVGEYLRRFSVLIGLSERARAGLQTRMERRFGASLDSLEVPTVARTMTLPLLVIHDRGDREVDWAEGATIATNWTGAELITTEGLGHRKILRDSYVVDRALRFLVGQRSFTCATHGCGRRLQAGCDFGLCPGCVVDRELFDRELRVSRASRYDQSPSRST